MAETEPGLHTAPRPPVTVEQLTDGQPFVVLAPHPDDDILGAAMLMRQARERGIACGVVFLTSGDASHFHPDWPPDRLARTRQVEALYALSTLLGEAPPVLFCELPDGKVGERWDDSTIELVTAFCRAIGAHALVTTAPTDDHDDHKAAFGIASVLWWNGAVAALWAMPVGSRIAGQEPGDMFQVLISDGQANAKRAAIDAHATQRGAVFAPEAGFTLDNAMIEPFLHREFFWPVAGIDPGREAPNDPDEFNTLFSQGPDPWNYDEAPYEQERFNRTVAALDGRKFHHGLEIACAAGVLTERLAPHCTHLIAVDASHEAIAHARRRLRRWPHVEIRHAIMPDQMPAGRFDLIMLSDVLYYLGLRGLIDFVATALSHTAPGAMVVLVNYLGPMGIAVNGDMAAEAAIAIARLHGWHTTHRERNDTMRIERLEPAQ